MLKYFGYTRIPCEMGSEGRSQWSDFGVYEGESIVEVLRDFIKKNENRTSPPSDKELMESIINDPTKPHEFRYHNYFTTVFIQLPSTGVYGHVGEISLSFPVTLHDDSKFYDVEKGGTQTMDYFEIHN